MVAATDRVSRCRLSRFAALLIIGVCIWVETGNAQNKANTLFLEEPSYVNNKRLGERLTVAFPNAPSEVSKSTAITLFEEGYYDAEAGRHDKRMVAIMTGMGLGATGLKIVLDDRHQIRVMDQCFKSFTKTYESYLSYRDDIEEKTEDWMGESWQAIGEGRPLGEVFFYPSKKSLQAEFHWDFELDRVWLSMGSRIFVDQEAVPYLSHMIGRLDAYKKSFFEYRETIKSKNREIDTLLGVNSH
jgi:hypothetical protein